MSHHENRTGKVMRGSVIAARLLALLVGLVCCSCTGTLYHPDRRVMTDPTAAGLHYEVVSFRASDNVLLNGWFVPAEEARATVLFCHGNAGNISHRLSTLTTFHRLGLNTFIFDYRGYGRSEGKPSEEGLYRDAEAAWRYLTETRRIPAKRIILVGRSLGGPVAAHLGRDHTPGAVVLESTFTSLSNEVDNVSSFPGGKLFVPGNFRTQEYVTGLRCPLLVVHSRQDDVVPYRLGRKLFDDAPEPKQFLEITGGHNEGAEVSGKIYTDGWEKFLNKLLPHEQ